MLALSKKRTLSSAHLHFLASPVSPPLALAEGHSKSCYFAPCDGAARAAPFLRSLLRNRRPIGRTLAIFGAAGCSGQTLLCVCRTFRPGKRNSYSPSSGGDVAETGARIRSAVDRRRSAAPGTRGSDQAEQPGFLRANHWLSHRRALGGSSPRRSGGCHAIGLGRNRRARSDGADDARKIGHRF